MKCRDNIQSMKLFIPPAPKIATASTHIAWTTAKNAPNASPVLFLFNFSVIFYLLFIFKNIKANIFINFSFKIINSLKQLFYPKVKAIFNEDDGKLKIEQLKKYDMYKQLEVFEKYLK